jgi:hypothetical protein
MHHRSALVVLTLFCAHSTLSANTTYDFGGTTNVSFATTSYTVAGTLASWTEAYTGGAGTTEQIDCLVAVLNITDTCGSPGPGSSKHIGIPSAPSNSGILPAGTTNYVEVDGDPTWGAPAWTTMTGLTVGGEYEISFYQASNEENGNNKIYDDSWQVYLIPGAASGSYICPVCATPVNPLPGDLAFTSPAMHNTGAVSTPWQLETFVFTATSATEILEFVTDAVATTAGAFQPPLLDLAGVSSQAVPEAGTWALTIIGVGLVFAGSRLRRRRSPAFKRVLDAHVATKR